MSQEQNKSMNQYFYRASAADFMKIPGSPLAYWASPKIVGSFITGAQVGDLSRLTAGLSTGDNAIFQRHWHEPSLSNIAFNAESIENIQDRRWVPCNSGGSFRKWYGNDEIIIDWEGNGHRIKKHKGSAVRNSDFYLKPGLTYSKISSGKFAIRKKGSGFIFDDTGRSIFPLDQGHENHIISLLCSKVAHLYLSMLAPSMSFTSTEIGRIPLNKDINKNIELNAVNLINYHRADWDSAETSWGFDSHYFLSEKSSDLIKRCYEETRTSWREAAREAQHLEEENNRLLIEAYGLQDELTPDVPMEEITLTCNPHYRYGSNRSEEELETLLQCDTLRELVSYAIGCMMGRYSLDKPGLILASQGETLQDYLRQIPSPRFAPDDDAILPLTDQEWFADDATNRYREFIRVVWGEEHLQQNLDFVAESLCLHAIKPKKGEASLDTIRRYLSTQFFKDHLRTYKKRPIYWLFSSGKHKAFECLVYLHRYNEGTLARMRTEYVIPLTAKLSTYVNKLATDIENETVTSEKKRLEKELASLHNQQAELATFDEKLRHYADQRISLDLDDGVKVNYAKFGDLLAEVKAVTGDKSSD